LTDAACRVELLDNGGFDSSTGSGDDKEISPWFNVISSGSRAMLVDTAAELALVNASAQAGGYAGHLGGENDAAHGLFTSVTVPHGARSLVVTGWFWVRSVETTQQPADALTVNLLDEDGMLLQQLGVLSAAQKGTAYVFRTLTSGAPYAGRTINLSLWVTTDGTFASDFFVDGLSMAAVLCP
jgi:hypothetical protein